MSRSARFPTLDFLLCPDCYARPTRNYIAVSHRPHPRVQGLLLVNTSVKGESPERSLSREYWARVILG